MPFTETHSEELALTRKAALSSSTYDADARTVEATLSTGSEVRRWFGIEKLEISPKAIDVSRVTSGLVRLLDTHNQFQMDAVLGSVIGTRIEQGCLIGTLQFADTEPGRRAEGMVSRRELTGISIGYRVNSWKVDKAARDTPETRTAIAWELLEASLVAVPADPACSTRSLSLETQTMTDTPTPTSATEVRRLDGQEALDFVKLARSFGEGCATYASELVLLNSQGKVRPKVMFEKLGAYAAERQAANTQGITGGISMPIDHTYDNPSFRGEAMAGALFARMSGQEPQEESREFMRLSVPQMAAELLAQNGERNVHRMSAYEAVERAWNTRSDVATVTTGTLPGLLENAANKFMMDRFEAAETPLKAIGKRRDAADFKDLTGIDLSGAGTLERLTEGGEIKLDTLSERKEKYRIYEHGKRYNITRQAIVNDDLGALSDMMTMLAQSAAKTEAILLASLLNSNPEMADGTPVFDASRNNLSSTGAAPSVDGFDEARKSMRDQKDLDGTPVIVAPKFVVANTEHQTKLEQILDTRMVPNSTSDVNPFGGRLEPLTDPRLTADGSWYLFGDPNINAALEYAYLNGQTGPRVEMREDWITTGTGFRVIHDFGCAFIDHRPAYKNPGS